MVIQFINQNLPQSHFGSNHGLSRRLRIFLHRLLSNQYTLILAIVACLVGRNDKLRVLGVFIRSAFVVQVIFILLLLILSI